MPRTAREIVVEQAARTAHSVNKAYCATLGDLSHLPYDMTPENIKASARNGVEAIIDRKIFTPEDAWKNWRQFKIDDGWVHGAVKDLEAKTHPNIVSTYDELPEQEQIKDSLFFAVVLSFIEPRPTIEE